MLSVDTMAARFRSFDRERQCAATLRAHTAEILHRATVGHAPHVGAALGVGKSRIQNMVTGDCANYLELLREWHDALEARGVEPDRLDDIAREVASWRRCGLAPLPAISGSEAVEQAAALSAREIGEALYTALTNSASTEEKVKEINEAIEALRRLALACEREHLAVVKRA